MQQYQAQTVEDIGEDVAELVYCLWQEAMGSLEDMLMVEVRKIKLEKVTGYYLIEAWINKHDV